MALADITFAKETINLPGGNSFTVRGISTDDIATLLRSRSDEIGKFFVKYAGQAKRAGNEAAIGMELLESAPGLMGEIIALAADEPTMAAVASRLPLPTQLEAIEKIASLTFDEAGGVGKFVEAVIRLVSGTTTFLQSQSNLKIGGKASGGK